MRKAEQNSTVQQLKSNLMGLGWGNYLISVCWKRITLKEPRSREAGEARIKTLRPRKPRRREPCVLLGAEAFLLLAGFLVRTFYVLSVLTI